LRVCSALICIGSLKLKFRNVSVVVPLQCSLMRLSELVFSLGIPMRDNLTDPEHQE